LQRLRQLHRGQINGPDFRFAALQQARELAEARAKRAEVQAQRFNREQAQITINQNSGAITPTFAGRRSFFTPFVQRGFGNFNPASTLPVRSNIGRGITGGPGNSGTLRGTGVNRSFGRAAISTPVSVHLEGGVKRDISGGPANRAVWVFRKANTPTFTA